MFHISNLNSATSPVNEVKVKVLKDSPMRDTRIVIRSVPHKSTLIHSLMGTANPLLNDAPLIDSMKFNDAQTAHWLSHTPPQVSTKVEKLVMLKKIALDQEKAGVHFEGRRSVAKAEVDLMCETLTQTSQSAQRQHLFSFVINSAKALANDFYYYLEGNPSIEETFDELSKPAGQSNFIIKKSKSLIKKETTGEPIINLGVGLIDSSHGSKEIQNGIKAYLKKNFDSGRGDIFLAEAVLVFESENGEEKIIRPSLELHHTQICLGVPIQSCRILSEPEKEITMLISAITERRKLVNRVFEFFMNAIPPSKAYEARQKLKNRNKEVRTADTSFKCKLLTEYQDYCDPQKQTRFRHRIESLKEALKKQNAAEAATQDARNKIYLEQISNAIKELKPSAKIYYSLGKECTMPKSLMGVK